jgi:hypothetical protein
MSWWVLLYQSTKAQSLEYPQAGSIHEPGYGFPRTLLLGNRVNRSFHYMPEQPVNMLPLLRNGAGVTSLYELFGEILLLAVDLLAVCVHR